LIDTGHEYTRSHIRTTQLKNAFVARCSVSMVHSLFFYRPSFISH